MNSMDNFKKFIPWGGRGGESIEVFALCPAQTKNAREKTDSLATFLNFKNTPESLEKLPKKGQNRQILEPEILTYISDRIKNR